MKIIIADDHFIVRAGLKFTLAADPEYQVVGEANNGQEAMELVNHLHPDIVIADIHMPIMSGLEVAKEIRKKYPHILIVIMSHSDEIKKIHEALKTGVNAYLLKSSAPEDLLLALSEIQAGRIYLSSEIPEYSEILSKIQKELNRHRPWLNIKHSVSELTDPMEFIRCMLNFMEGFSSINTEDLVKDGQILSGLHQFLHKDKIYTNEKLTAAKAAQMLKVEPYYLSDLIMKNHSITFPQLASESLPCKRSDADSYQGLR